MAADVFRVTDGVLLTGAGLAAARYAVDAAKAWREANGSPPLRSLEVLRSALSVAGHADVPIPENPKDGLKHLETITTEEAARLIGCSPRQARRQARQLGGRLDDQFQGVSGRRR